VTTSEESRIDHESDKKYGHTPGYSRECESFEDNIREDSIVSHIDTPDRSIHDHSDTYPSEIELDGVSEDSMSISRHEKYHTEEYEYSGHEDERYPYPVISPGDEPDTRESDSAREEDGYLR
jgi:hypothetical protein